MEAVKQVLPAEQFATWEKARNERKAELEKKITEFLKPQLGRTEDQYRQAYTERGEAVIRTASLPKEFAKEFDELAITIAKKAVEKWQRQAAGYIRNADEQQRHQILKRGEFYVGFDEEDTEKLEEFWNVGLKAKLPAEAAQRLEKSKAEQRSRRVRAWSEMLIAELDKRVAFTAVQREKLQPIVEAALTKRQSRTSNMDEDEAENGIPLNILFAAGLSVKPSEIESILDEKQRKRWHDACRNRGGDGESRVVWRNQQPTEEEKQPQPVEPEEIEGLLSDYLFDKASRERDRALNAMIVKTEDAARVAGLGQGAIERLETAARGATDEAVGEWKATLYEMVRPYANGGTLQMVSQRLANMQDYRLQRGGNQPERLPIWEETVKAELTPEQKKAWDAEVSQRNDYRDKAIANAVLEAFAEKVHATSDQIDKVRALLVKVMTEYSPEINNMFSNSNTWYLQRYYMFLPFAGIPEGEMKSILSKEQMETWMGCNEFSNATSYWENIKRTHEQRTKPKKAAAPAAIKG
jgi:hypothetical protein